MLGHSSKDSFLFLDNLLNKFLEPLDLRHSPRDNRIVSPLECIVFALIAVYVSPGVHVYALGSRGQNREKKELQFDRTGIVANLSLLQDLPLLLFGALLLARKRQDFDRLKHS